MVRVAVGLPNGKRVTDSLPNTATLREVVDRALRKGGVALSPADTAATGVLFLRQMIPAKDLDTTSLADIGLREGSGMLRMRTLGSGSQSPMLESPREAAPPKTEDGTSTAAAVDASMQDDDGGDAPATLSDSHAQESQPMRDADDADRVGATAAGERDPEREAASIRSQAMERLRALRDLLFDEDARVTLKSLCAVLDNVLRYPSDFRRRTLRLSNAAVRNKIAQHSPAVDLLRLAGFVEKGGEDPCLESTLEEGERPRIVAVRDVVAQGMQDLDMEVADTPSTPTDAYAAMQSFNPFRSSITQLGQHPAASSSAASSPDGESGEQETGPWGANTGAGAPSEPRPQRDPSATTLEQKVARLKARREAIIGTDTPPRRTQVFLPGSGVHPGRFSATDRAVLEAEAVDLQQPTSGRTSSREKRPRSDAQLLMDSLRRRTSEMEKAGQVRTKAMRELEALEQSKVYRVCLLRVQLPDRTLMQAFFNPNERIADVEAWIRSWLAVDAAQIDRLELFSSPPRTVHTPETTLQDAGLVPASSLFASLEGTSPGQMGDAGSLLVANWRERMEQEQQATGADQVHLREPVPLVKESTEPAAGATAPAAAPRHSHTGGSGRGGQRGTARDKGKPRWLKIG